MLYRIVSSTRTKPPTKSLLLVLCAPSIDLKATESNNKAGQDFIASLTRSVTIDCLKYSACAAQRKQSSPIKTVAAMITLPR